MITRLQLADEILQVLQTGLQGVDAHLRGSLATDTTDDFSDIDIGVRCLTRTDKELSAEITALMQERYELVFLDWARSLLPTECIISFFISDVPVHWQVDIEIDVPDTKRVVLPEDIVYEYPDHFLKLWIGVSKHVARSVKGHKDEVGSLCQRVLREAGKPEWGCTRMLNEILQHLESAASGKYPEFFCRCKAIMKMVEQMHAHGQ